MESLLLSPEDYEEDFDDDEDNGFNTIDNDKEDDSSDHQEFEKYQAKLMQALDKFSGTKKGKIKVSSEVRTEAAKNASEFALTKKREAGKKTLSIESMLKSLKKNDTDKAFEKLSKKIKSTAQEKKLSKTLETPLEKPVFQKVTREVLYDNVKKDVSKWNSIVYHNRLADQLVFPFNAAKKLPKRTGKDAAAEFMPQTPLEEEMAKVLYGEEYLIKKKAEMQTKISNTDAETFSLTVEEALAKHSEMAHLRALQSYEVAKAKRKNKIKSKKYHRILRREKIKKQLKEFEELQVKDPDAAMVKLEELDKSRIEERMSLKHRNTSKWAKMQAARAKYNKESRLALNDQLKISHDLTQKFQESSDDDEEDLDIPQLVKSTVNNPWMLLKNKAGDADEVRDLNVNELELNLEIASGVASLQTEGNNLSVRSKRSVKANETGKKPRLEPKSLPKAIDPTNYLKIASGSAKGRSGTKFNGDGLKDVDLDDDSDEDAQRMVIAEAFEDDDVVAEFQERKNELIEASKPKDLDLTLPGWGEWGGKNIKPSQHKRKRFLQRAPSPPPRKDSTLPHVILHEEANAKLREHQVRELPFPFKRVKDFEKIIRAPVGRTWLPEQAMKNLTAPKVITRLGAVIKPISEDVLAKAPSAKGGKKSFSVPSSIINLTAKSRK